MKNYLLKFIKSGIGVGLSAIFGLLLLRSISKEQGPEGLATFGVFRQFLQSCAVFFTCGNGMSIIESYSKAKDKEHFISNAFKYFLLITLVVGLVTILLSYPIAVGLFDNDKNWSLIALAPLIFIGMSFQAFFRLLVTAKQHLITSSLLQAAPFTLMFVFYAFSKNIFIYFILAYWVSSLFAFILWRLTSEEKIQLNQKFSRILSFEKTSLATIITGAISFVSLLIVKSVSVHALGLSTTGVIEAESSLTGYVTLALISGLGTFYLAKVSENPHDQVFREKIFKFLIPVTTLVLSVLIYFDQFFIGLLFGKGLLFFSPSLSVFGMGELLRCMNTFFIFSMIGMGQRKSYITFELISYTVYVLASAIIVTIWPYRESIEYSYLIFQTAYLVLNFTFCLKIKTINPRFAIKAVGFSILFLSAVIFFK